MEATLVQGSFLTIGRISFSFIKPGPYAIDVNLLTEQEKGQLLYNWRRGWLQLSNPNELLILYGVPEERINEMVDFEDVNVPASVQNESFISHPKTMRKLGDKTITDLPKLERNIIIRAKIADFLTSPLFIIIFFWFTMAAIGVLSLS